MSFLSTAVGLQQTTGAIASKKLGILVVSIKKRTGTGNLKYRTVTFFGRLKGPPAQIRLARDW
jgi:hypothetical protein